jgi:hypothetical protein
VSRRSAHEARAGEVVWLTLDLLILLWAGGVAAGEVKVAKGSTRSGHHLLEFLLLLVPEAILLIIVALVVVVLLGIVLLVGGRVEFVSLEAVDDEVGGVTALKTAPKWSSPLLAELVQAQNFLANKAISSSRMFSYCSSEVTPKEDKVNSKANEIVVLVGLASWSPTWALVIKVLLVREASELGRPFLDNSWDFNLLNSFSMSRVAKSAYSSKAVIFMPQIWSSSAYNNCLARSLSEYVRGPQERKLLIMDSNLAKQSSKSDITYYKYLYAKT